MHKRVQMSAKEDIVKCKYAKERKRAQKGAKEHCHLKLADTQV